MKTVLSILFSLSLLPGTSDAHSDPRGDVHPGISVSEGRFVIDFLSNLNTSDSDKETGFRMIHSPEGKVLVPRHRIPLTEKERNNLTCLGREQHPHVAFGGVENSDTLRAILRIPGAGNGRVDQPLPFTLKTAGRPPYWAETTTLQRDWVAFTWGDNQGTDLESKTILNLALVAWQGFTEGITIPIGEVATIYDFPRVSNPVWAAGKWWIVWVRVNPDHETPNTTLLSSYDPATKKLESITLNEESTWNTTLSLATTSGWLCAAWHTGPSWVNKPAHARIVTIFHRLPEG